jgi:hypothetical protein
VARPLFHPEATTEYIEAIAWYAARSPRAASRFEEEVEHVLQRIEADFCVFPRYDEFHRFAVVPRFPYSVVYRELGGKTYVVAIAHASRAPGFWVTRAQ